MDFDDYDAVDMVIQERQCSRLRALSKVLRACGDPDWWFPLTVIEGVPVGVGVDLPWAPDIYEEKVRWALGQPNGDPE